MRLKYYIPECDQKPEDAVRSDHAYLDDELGYAAEDAAADFFWRRDGWNAPWPLVFILIDTSTDREVGRFEVEANYNPIFIASETPNA